MLHLMPLNRPTCQRVEAVMLKSISLHHLGCRCGRDPAPFKSVQYVHILMCLLQMVGNTSITKASWKVSNLAESMFENKNSIPAFSPHVNLLRITATEVRARRYHVTHWSSIRDIFHVGEETVTWLDYWEGWESHVMVIWDVDEVLGACDVRFTWHQNKTKQSCLFDRHVISSWSILSPNWKHAATITQPSAWLESFLGRELACLHARTLRRKMNAHPSMFPSDEMRE